jgi:ABC-type amino acid transport substrate-binding protein
MSFQSKKQLCMLTASMLLASAFGAFAQTPFRIAYNESIAPLIPLVRAVYVDMGIHPEFVLLPGERALLDTSYGKYDADLSRAGGVIDAYPELIQTKEPLRKTELYAYAKKKSSIVIRNASDLKGHTLGLIRGAKLAEDYVLHESLEAQYSPSAASFYAMLVAERFEIALVTSIQVTSQAKELGEHAQRVGGPLATGYSFHVLHRKHAALMPRFDAALLAIKKSGRAEQLLAPPLPKP